MNATDFKAGDKVVIHCSGAFFDKKTAILLRQDQYNQGVWVVKVDGGSSNLFIHWTFLHKQRNVVSIEDMNE